MFRLKARPLWVLGVLVFAGAFTFFAWPSLRGAYVEEFGVVAPGVVLEVRDSEHYVDRRPLTHVVVEVRPVGQTPFRASADQRFEQHELHRVARGASVDVKYLPNHPGWIHVVRLR